MQDTSLTSLLKLESKTAHEYVDHLMMSYHPFKDKESYGKFLKLQEVFHRIVQPIYFDEENNKKIHGLRSLARHGKVLQDMQDLGVSSLGIKDLPYPTGPEAIGWLYCAEGSNIGAALLIKEAKKIDINEKYGARHLAPHADGRGQHWRAFAKKFDEVFKGLSAEKVLKGAKESFHFYQKLARDVFGATT